MPSLRQNLPAPSPHGPPLQDPHARRTVIAQVHALPAHIHLQTRPQDARVAAAYGGGVLPMRDVRREVHDAHVVEETYTGGTSWDTHQD